ncbi:protein kinase domain protein [Ichthyophthirius multifiliis]|uniref:Protein kinase domain protein n=1 Tax=Ichthyophthirius multifiliis TaxID=5932 RepID=G0QPV0_ICHMU|nr:protein kinase domain protein [Ichthyophthirius multifiliis]EGR32749.1 protein kinase domain protein [Ichthyophthirius multifiliis]|eukprot:XP_004036735.1 protein kinase domain protein [Ichthyophthirius multifiliis]
MENEFYKTSNIKEEYKFDKILGEGSFAVVYKAIKKSNNEELAIKVFDKQQKKQTKQKKYKQQNRVSLEYDDQMALETECDIMSNIDHPNIVKCSAVYDEKSKFYMVMELMTGGELFDRIVEKETYSEKEAVDVIRPIVDAINYCNKMGIAHRDLKPENLLYNSPDPDATIKITDFGLAKVISDELMTTACGTPSYIAPEVLTGKGYSFSVDYWSIGVILYVLLCGFPPFYQETNDKLFESIKKGEFGFPSPQWDNISENAKDLIRNLLKVDPKQRYGPEQILNHPWIKGEASKRHLAESQEALRQYNARRRLRRAQLSVVAANRFKHLIMNK